MPRARFPRLTLRRQRFVDEYLLDGNATQAAIRAGYARASARVEGSRLLTSAAVQAAVARGNAARARRADVSADWVIMQLLSLHASTVESEPEVARKALRDVGDAIGMYEERHVHEFPQLSSDERGARVSMLLNAARQRAIGAGDPGTD